MNPKVSIILCTRNRPKLLLERSLPSVLNQTFKDFEVIIIDDASEQLFSEQLVGLYVRYYRNKERKGLAWNKNFGISKAKGEYIVFLDDDNEFHPEFLECLVFWAEKMKDMVIFTCLKKLIYPEGKIIHEAKSPCSINDGFLIRKRVFEKLKFDETLQANEDADFGIRFFKEYENLVVVKNPSNTPLMTVYGSPIFNTTSYSDYTDYHLDGLAKFWLKHHDYKKYIGRMFLLSAGSPKWFKWLWWLEQKIKRYYQIWSS